MRVRIDEARCEGHGRCYALAPELFEPDEIGNGRLISGSDVPVDFADDVRLAIANCPERAIVDDEEPVDG